MKRVENVTRQEAGYRDGRMPAKEGREKEEEAAQTSRLTSESTDEAVEVPSALQGKAAEENGAVASQRLLQI